MKIKDNTINFFVTNYRCGVGVRYAWTGQAVLNKRGYIKEFFYFIYWYKNNIELFYMIYFDSCCVEVIKTLPFVED